MTRRTWFLISVLTLGCGAGNEESSFSPPANLPGAGALEGFESLPVDGVADHIRSMGLEQAHVARYSGELPVTANFYRMKNGPAAFELVQKWRPTDGKLATYSGAWFVVIESPGADNAALSSIANGIEAALAE